MTNFYKIVLLVGGIWLPLVATATAVNPNHWLYTEVNEFSNDWTTTNDQAFLLSELNDVLGSIAETERTYGASAFGSEDQSGLPVVNTNWKLNSALYLQKEVNISQSELGTYSLNLAIDNDALVWINDKVIFKIEDDGGASIDKYSTDFDFMDEGTYIISAIANDHGAFSYFDLQGLPSQVPLPAAAYFFISALGGLVAVKRKQKKA